MIRIVFEGLPGAGKTTLARGVSDALACPLIPEWTLDEPSWRDRRTTVPWYLVNEEAKAFLASRLREPLVLFDRHYVGALAFDHARARTSGDDGPYRAALAWYREACAAGRIVRPTRVYVLDVPPAVSLARQPRAREVSPLFSSEPALDAMREYYRIFHGENEPEVAVTVLDGRRPCSEHLRRVIEETGCLIK